MDEKTLDTLEYPKVLERLAAYAAFSASAELARGLRPPPSSKKLCSGKSDDHRSRLLLSVNAEAGIGGATDMRPLVERAARRGVLDSVRAAGGQRHPDLGARAGAHLRARRPSIPTWVRSPHPSRPRRA